MADNYGLETPAPVKLSELPIELPIETLDMMADMFQQSGDRHALLPLLDDLIMSSQFLVSDLSDILSCFIHHLVWFCRFTNL